MIYDHPVATKIYPSSPRLVQNALLSLYGALVWWERTHAPFTKYLAELEASQWYSRAEMEALQTERLRVLIRHAYENVPYYRRIFEERRLKPDDIRRADDLYKLPVLRKQDIRRYQDELRARNIPLRATLRGHSSGTTAVPNTFLLDKTRITYDRAQVLRFWRWAGYQPRDRIVMLRVMMAMPYRAEDKRPWRFDVVNRRMYVAVMFSPELVDKYVAQLRRWQPKFIAAIPSALLPLAEYLEQHHMTLPLRAVFTSSEVLTAAHRAQLERAFACKVWDRYGLGERTVVGQECEYGNYHQSAEFGILQVDAPRGVPAPKGATGELIQTGLTNFSMPLIRFASEDYGSLPEGDCPCGRGLPQMGRVDGRYSDFIVTGDGLVVAGTMICSILENVSHGLDRCQLAQERPGEIIVRLIPRADYDRAAEIEISDAIRKRVGQRTRIRLEPVSKLQDHPSGKRRFVVSSLNVNLTQIQRAPIQTMTENES